MTANLDWCLARRIGAAHYDTLHSVPGSCPYCRYFRWPLLCVLVRW